MSCGFVRFRAVTASASVHGGGGARALSLTLAPALCLAPDGQISGLGAPARVPSRDPSTRPVWGASGARAVKVRSREGVPS